MSDELDKILNKAKAEAAAAEERENRGRQANNRNKQQEQLPVTPADDERYAVYRYLSASQVSFVEFVIFFSIALTFFMVWLINSGDPLWAWRGYDLFLLCGCACIAVLLLRLLYTALYARFTFSTFRKWRQELPYRLEGWPELVDMPKFGRGKWWRRECKITVHFSSPNKQAQETFDELAKAMCRNANKCFYAPGFGDPRVTWNFKDFQLTGSVNGAVARKIYAFLKTDMALLAKRYNQPAKIIITVRGEVEEVEPESSD